MIFVFKIHEHASKCTSLEFIISFNLIGVKNILVTLKITFLCLSNKLRLFLIQFEQEVFYYSLFGKIKVMYMPQVRNLIVITFPSVMLKHSDYVTASTC